MGNFVEKQFERMGARVRVRAPDRPISGSRWYRPPETPPVRLNVIRDRVGEYFDIQLDSRRASVEVVDVQPQARHLLLMSRNAATGEKEKFLCGHDERAWFVAAVPGRSTSNVKTAFEALKPPIVQVRQAAVGVPTRHRHRRRNEAYIRQGEWFFVPEPRLSVSPLEVLRNEPLRRGGGKPHMAEFCFRKGGERVYVSQRYPNGLTTEAYTRLIQSRPSARAWNWRVMIRDAGVFVRGRIRHSDHKTIELNGWHQVLLNTETDAPSMRHVAFLD